MKENIPQDQEEIATDQERRKIFLRYVNRGWLVLGIVALVTLPIFPDQRGEFTWVMAMAFPTYLIIRILNSSGRTRLAGMALTLVVNFGFYGLFLMLVAELGAYEAFDTQATVWMLMGLAVLFAGAFVDKWAAPAVALFNTILLIATRLALAPGADPRPSAVLMWWMLALTIWLYEGTLSRALARVWAELAQRRKAEMELQESRNFLQQVVDTSPSMIFVVDSQGKVVFVNRYTAQYYETTPEQLIAKSTQDVHQREKEAVEFVGDHQEVVRTRKRIVKEELNTAPNGEGHWFHTVKVPLVRPDGTVEVLGISTDITERKQAEETLIESEERFRSLSEAAFEGIMIHDKGIILNANQAFAELFGFHRPEDLIRKYGLDTLPLAPESRELLRANLSTRATEPVEIMVIRPDGTMFPAETQGRDITFNGRKLRVVSMRDITKRKRAEEQLRQTTATLDAIVTASPVGIVSYDLEGQVETWNQAAEQIFGWKREEVLGRFAPHIPPAILPEFHALLSRVLGGEVLLNVELPRQRKDATPIDISLNAAPMYDSAGTITGHMAMIQDITERKRAEEAFRESEAYYRMLTESLSDFVVHMDREGKILYINHLAEGYTMEQVQGSSTYDYVPPEYHETMRQALNKVFQNGQTVTFETQGQTSASVIGWYLTRLVPVREDEEVTGALLISTDITERKQAEEKIRKLSRAVEQSPASIVITNTVGEIEYVNPKFTQVTGYTSEAALGKNPRILKSGYTAQQEYKQMWEAITSGQEWHGEFHNKKKNGDLYWESAVISSISNDHGEITHFIAVKEDITGRKRAEETLRRRVNELTALYQTTLDIISPHDLPDLLNTIVARAVDLLGGTGGGMYLCDPEQEQTRCVVSYKTPEDYTGTVLAYGEGAAGTVAATGEPLIIDDYRNWEGRAEAYEENQPFSAVISAPMLWKGQVTGVIHVLHDTGERKFTGEDLKLLTSFANQAAVAVENAQLFNHLHRSNNELSKAYDATIEGWSKAMDLRDKETEGHTVRVTELTLRMAQSMGLKEEQIIHIRRGGLLHDIGKLGVPDNILLKHENLTDVEWEIMRKHPTYAYEMLSSITYLEPALDIPYCHHEKWDGTGYPRGLKGEQIPIVARIFAIVDVWDALTSDRPYRSAWTKEETLKYIKEQSEKYFDPQVVDVFLRLVADK